MNDSDETEFLLGVSISGGPDLLSYGFGNEHLRELLIRICRPIIVEIGKAFGFPVQLAYSGHIGEESFALDLIELISTEKAENASGSENLWQGKLYNPLPWPHYQHVTPAYEATWINACKFVRISQEMADLDEVIEFPPRGVLTPRIAYNRARVLTKTRQLMSTGLKHDDGNKWLMPPLTWRVAVGGKVTGFTGIMPGVFEEVRYALDPPAGHRRPRVYILGGFGGAAHELARALLGDDEVPAFRVDYHKEKSQPHYRLMQEGYRLFGSAGEPGEPEQPEQELQHLASLIKNARGNLKETFQNGLTETENETLLRSSDFSDVSRLIFKGLLNADMG